MWGNLVFRGQEAGGWGASLSSASNVLCDPGQAPGPLWSRFPSVRCSAAFSKLPLGRDRRGPVSLGLPLCLGAASCTWGPASCVASASCVQSPVRVLPWPAASILFLVWDSQLPCRPGPGLLRGGRPFPPERFSAPGCLFCLFCWGPPLWRADPEGSLGTTVLP